MRSSNFCIIQTHMSEKDSVRKKDLSFAGISNKNVDHQVCFHQNTEELSWSS